MGDIDVGEMFLNFCLHEDIQKYCGVDLQSFFGLESGTQMIWEKWVRCLMGLRSSPYLTVKGLSLGLEWVIGDTTDPLKVFYWSTVRLNLPGHKSYNPTLPWISCTKFVEGNHQY